MNSRVHLLVYNDAQKKKSSVDYKIENSIKWQKKFALKLQKSTWPPSKYHFKHIIGFICDLKQIFQSLNRYLSLKGFQDPSKSLIIFYKIFSASSWTQRSPSSPSPSWLMLPSLVTASARFYNLPH